jgi:hypothetical protein
MQDFISASDVHRRREPTDGDGDPVAAVRHTIQKSSDAETTNCVAAPAQIGAGHKTWSVLGIYPDVLDDCCAVVLPHAEVQN